MQSQMLGRMKPAAIAVAMAALLAGCAGGGKGYPNGPEHSLYPWEIHPPGAAAECPPASEDIRLDDTNTATPSFGCATSQNLAAMVAYPSDLAGPQPMTAPDWGREERVLNAWRDGQTTQSAKGQTGTTSMLGQ